ncbi:alpha/beta hydrolase [Actinomyces vulturis]|uniref:alpha/beta hydrolase n=1 Tax=Actinomyces vulturis TaxID=1857645 RepID=UPI0008314FEB|nr:alpha/beta hydrolase [Actinomyces vulturis]
MALTRLAKSSMVLLAAGSLFLLGACEDLQSDEAGPSAQPVPIEGSAAPIPEGLEQFYEQTIDWSECGTNYECGSLTVPVDYSKPDGQTLTLELKQRTNDGSLGHLLLNPGGPGGSGIDLVENLPQMIPHEVTDNYTLVGFDPRGVGKSTPVDCISDEEMDEERSADYEAVEEPSDADRKEIADFAHKCQVKTEEETGIPDLLDHIDTVSAAKDMDVIRAVLGDNHLNYLGYSYGTYLGATYADLFPANVGRMVLDGAIDPSLSAADLSAGQAEGFEKALRAYVENCQAGNKCPLTGDVDNGVRQIQQFLEATKTAPIPTSDPDRPLTYGLAMSGIIGPLYQDESWDVLTMGLDQAMKQHDGSVLLMIADLMAGREDDGSYDGNSGEVISAINCLDYPVEGDNDLWNKQAEELKKLSPTFGADMGYVDFACEAWGHPSTRERKPIHAQGSAPILIVGTTGDPATPYQWAVNLDDQLSDSELLTWEGEGHTAFGRAGACINNAVSDYLISGTMPKEGTVCKGRN